MKRCPDCSGYHEDTVVTCDCGRDLSSDEESNSKPSKFFNESGMVIILSIIIISCIFRAVTGFTGKNPLTQASNTTQNISVSAPKTVSEPVKENPPAVAPETDNQEDVSVGDDPYPSQVSEDNESLVRERAKKRQQAIYNYGHDAGYSGGQEDRDNEYEYNPEEYWHLPLVQASTEWIKSRLRDEGLMADEYEFNTYFKQGFFDGYKAGYYSSP